MENSSDPLLLLLALPVFFLFLGVNSIWDANEAFYVETPRQMVLTGDYIAPSFNGVERLNKPVLSYWIVAGVYHVFGVSVGAERLAIALGAMGIIAAAFLIGRALHSTATGVWAALIVATAPRVVFFSRRIFIDVYITLFMSLALAGFVLAERHPEHRRRYLLLMYAAIGLGALTKGPIALALPGLVCVLWLVLEHRLADLRRLMLVPGTLIVLAIVVPWYVAVYQRYGWEPISAFIFGENLDRYRSAFTGERPPWFFLGVLFGDILMPWAPLLLVPMATAWKRAASGELATHAAIRRLLWLWIAVIVLFFSMSASKEDLYILPVVPAAAALIAETLVRSGFGQHSRAVRLIFRGVSVACVALAVLVFRVFDSGYYAIPDAPFIALVLAAAGLSGLALSVTGRASKAVLAFAASFVVLNYAVVARVLPGAERLKPVPPLAQVLAERATPGSKLGAFNMMLPSLVFYAGRPVRDLSEGDAVAWLSAPDEAWVVTGATEWETLHTRVPQTCIAARRALFPFDRMRPESVRKNLPPPDVLLVTNRCG